MTNRLASLAQRDYFYLDPFWSVNLGMYIIKESIASSMSYKLEPVIWLRLLVTLAYMEGRTDGRTDGRTYGRS